METSLELGFLCRTVEAECQGISIIARLFFLLITLTPCFPHCGSRAGVISASAERQAEVGRVAVIGEE
jgi:hypothetical protein